MKKTKGIVIRNIRTILSEKGMTGERLCLETGLSKSHYYTFMAGKTKDLNLSTLEKIANGLEVTIARLVTE